MKELIVKKDNIDITLLDKDSIDEKYIKKSTTNGLVMNDGSIDETLKAPSVHSHGNLNVYGKVGLSNNQNKNVVTDARGFLTTESKIVVENSLTSDSTSDALSAAQGKALKNSLDSKVSSDDSRLSDARNPLSHAHGDITNDGKIGSTSGLPIITTTDGQLTTGNFGTNEGEFAEGNHTHFEVTNPNVGHQNFHLYKWGKVVSFYIYEWPAAYYTSASKDVEVVINRVVIPEGYRPPYPVYIKDVIKNQYVIVGNDGVTHVLVANDISNDVTFHGQATWITLE